MASLAEFDDCLVNLPQRRADASRSVPSGCRAPQPLQPGVQVEKDIGPPCGIGVFSNLETAQWGCQVSPAIAYEEPVPLELGNTTFRPQPGHGSGEIRSVGNLSLAKLCAPFGH